MGISMLETSLCSGQLLGAYCSYAALRLSLAPMVSEVLQLWAQGGLADLHACAWRLAPTGPGGLGERQQFGLAGEGRSCSDSDPFSCWEPPKKGVRGRQRAEVPPIYAGLFGIPLPGLDPRGSAARPTPVGRWRLWAEVCGICIDPAAWLSCALISFWAMRFECHVNALHLQTLIPKWYMSCVLAQQHTDTALR